MSKMKTILIALVRRIMIDLPFSRPPVVEPLEDQMKENNNHIFTHKVWSDKMKQLLLFQFDVMIGLYFTSAMGLIEYSTTHATGKYFCKFICSISQKHTKKRSELVC